jgi:uncharacterized SAM-binding protein YcdF (DUF218 family)
LTVFFVLSKLLAFFAHPSNLIVLLGLIGLALTRTRFAGAGWRLAAASLILIGLIGFLPLGRALSLPLENRFPPWDVLGAPPAGIVVLGGAVSTSVLASRREIGINEAAERVIAVPAQAKRYPAARIIYSGGDAGLFVHHESEADVVTELFESLGIPASRITLEGRSRNTIENAVYSKALAQPKPGRTMASRYIRPPYAARYRRIPAGRVCGRSLSRRLPDQRLGGRTGRSRRRFRRA